MTDTMIRVAVCRIDMFLTSDAFRAALTTIIVLFILMLILLKYEFSE